MIWRNSLWNLLGMLVPLVVGLLSMGLIARELQVERFGIFLLAFSVLGYANIFDAGLTRAVILFIAVSNRDIEKERKIMSTATVTVMFLSSVAALLLYFFSSSIVGFINVTEDNIDDVLKAFKTLSFIIIPTLLSLVWFSFLEGRQEFFKLNIYKTITGSIIAIAPMIAVYIEPTLYSTILGLLVGRVIYLFISFYPNFLIFGFDLFRFEMAVLKKLFRFGGWITLSNIISPLMVYSDRFILSSILGANKVAFYAAPSEVIARMSAVPGAIAKTLFPLFSGDNDNSRQHAKSAYLGMLFILALMVLCVFLFGDWALGLWLGSAYVGEAGIVLKILVVGFFFNSLAQIPFSRIQAHNKSRLTAFIHIFEVVPYLLLLIYLVEEAGLVGAAIAWSLRMFADFIILEYFSKKI